MSGVAKYKSANSAYHPTGGTSNGKRNMYETGTCDETYYTDEETAFIMAMDKYKREHDRKFPTWHEVLAVLKSLGYRKHPTAERCNGQETPERIEITQTYTLSALSRAG